MLPQVKTTTQNLNEYQEIIPKKLYQEVESLAKDLKGLKVAMINSTPR